MVSETGVFHFEYPFWLIALILPVILWWLPRAQLREDYFDRLKSYADKALMPYLIIMNKDVDSKTRRLFFYWSLLWFLAVLAMAGPRWDYTDIQVFEPGTDVIIVLDISKSMEANDVQPSRFARARQEISDFIEQTSDMRIGLIAFASVAHVISPITDDKRAIQHFLSALSPRLIKVKGSRVIRALEKARRMLAGQPPGNEKVILLVSDGDFDAKNLHDFISKLFQEGIRLYTMGVGDKKGAIIHNDQGGWIIDSQGQRVISYLEEEELAEMAKLGGGGYVNATYRDTDTKELKSKIASHRADRVIEKNPIRIWHERYYLLILLMLPLVLQRFRRIKSVTRR